MYIEYYYFIVEKKFPKKQLRQFAFQCRLRQEADIRRTTLEEEHLSLGTRRVVAGQNLSATQTAHDTLARQLADNETYVQLNNMEKKVCI